MFSVLQNSVTRLVYEYSAIDKGARILLVAKDAKAGLEVTAQGIKLGKVVVKDGILDLVNCTAIRAVGG